ncbi:hypothetical protein MARLIPOL_14870 [Marinobacter lipolyticus SM19]|uniref:Uncharacterized protein n=1 Tax=Marinobacter lipolyticus SM19 TaxID=1318628 RepID=R8AY03_9GAMM|nr:hypothetical protein [Marinobacter lipolyticus]EON91192.1 hypothetical protein MARLIPOL_14870 [Marinobacter lipolyticus SM19]
MSALGRWILYGWLFVLVVALGLLGGFMLYTRVIIGVSLTDQFALLRLPAELRVDAHTEENAELTLLGQVDVKVPFHHEALPLHLKGQYRTQLDLDTMVPLRMEIHYRDTLTVETDLDVSANTGMIYSWLPELPVRGVLPVRFDLPVDMVVPVETMVRLKYSGEVLAAIDQVVRPSVDTELLTSLNLNLDIESPVKNRFSAIITPEKRAVPIILDDSVLKLPLQDLGFFRVDAGH